MLLSPPYFFQIARKICICAYTLKQSLKQIFDKLYPFSTMNDENNVFMIFSDLVNYCFTINLCSSNLFCYNFVIIINSTISIMSIIALKTINIFIVICVIVMFVCYLNITTKTLQSTRNLTVHLEFHPER